MNTQQETEALANTSDQSDTESENEEANAVRVMQPKKILCSYKYIALVIVGVFMVLAIVILCGIYVVKDLTPEFEDTKTTDDILPNTELIITSNGDTLISGELVVADEIRYNFVSISNTSIELIDFQQISEPATHQNWYGFQVYHLNAELTIKLMNVNHIVHSIIMNRSKGNMSPFEMQILELFLGNILCEDFIQLSIKLGKHGYTGQMNHAIEDIHRFAVWMWSIVLDDENIDNSQWFLTEEKMNAINSASLDNSESHGPSRNLLGNCGDPYSRCGNDCFGMCGKGCSCWSSVCGDCECWLGCEEHDRLCCENGYNSYCCLNVFWVKCDGTGSCS